jgi:hypothetical protein
MRDLQRQNRFREAMYKKSFFHTKSMDKSYEFIYHWYHCLLITTKIFLFANKVISKVRVPFHHTYCHLEENISEKARYILILSLYLPDCFTTGSVPAYFISFFALGKFLIFLISARKSPAIYSWLKEKEFVNVEDESFRKVRVINADRVFSSLDDFLWCKRSWFTSADRVFDNFREPFRLSFFESFSRGIFVQYMQKRMRVDVKESFSFREKYSKALFDLIFSLTLVI